MQNHKITSQFSLVTLLVNPLLEARLIKPLAHVAQILVLLNNQYLKTWGFHSDL